MEELLKVSETEKRLVNKYYNTNWGYLKRDVEILKDWYRYQPHLPQGVEDDEFFQSFLIKNKCRVEQTKLRIDDYFTLKGVHKEFFQEIKNIVPSLSTFLYLPLPTLTPNQERVILVRMQNTTPSVFDFKELTIMAIAFSDILMRNDCSIAQRIIVDYKGTCFEHYLRVTPTVLAKLSQILMDAYSSRLSGLDFFNTPSFIGTILGLLKRILKEKIFKRIKVHKNHASISKEIPKHILPKEYGGTEFTIPELLEKWDIVFRNQREHLELKMSQVSNEKLRVRGPKFSSQIFGVEGTFKQLNID